MEVYIAGDTLVAWPGAKSIEDPATGELVIRVALADDDSRSAAKAEREKMEAEIRDAASTDSGRPNYRRWQAPVVVKYGNSALAETVKSAISRVDFVLFIEREARGYKEGRPEPSDDGFGLRKGATIAQVADVVKARVVFHFGFDHLRPQDRDAVCAWLGRIA